MSAEQDRPDDAPNPGQVPWGAEGARSAVELAAENAALAAKLAVAEKARDEMKDLAQRTLADFQNYKARALKDAQAARRFTVKESAAAVLPAFDNLERALDAGGDGAEAAKALRDGVRLTLQTFSDGLGRIGVTRVTTRGAPFDPVSMEALARIETADQPEGSVVAEWESGWRLPDLVVRPARVSVAVRPKASSAGGTTAEESP
jgi:molecular chaperone GrpE